MGVEVEVFVNPEAFRPDPPRGHITLFPQLQVINRVLSDAGLPAYPGPRGGTHLCLRIGSYSTLAALMYHAADLALGQRPHRRSYWEYLVEGYSVGIIGVSSDFFRSASWLAEKMTCH